MEGREGTIQPRPLLSTKLYTPRPRAGLIARPRLTKELEARLDRTLTVVSAPAGYGKTTLVSTWIAGSQIPVAWLSLDEGDSDAHRFLAYFVAALQQIEPAFGASVLAALRTPLSPPLESLLDGLINELVTLPYPLILVLDDYHVIESEPIHAGLDYLLSHLPPRSCPPGTECGLRCKGLCQGMHLIIIGRTEPPLHLARLRAQDQVNEIRSQDLRFTVEETTAFLNEAMALRLTARQVRALAVRTEGWIAGLKLAAISLQRRSDVDGFVDAFTGSHRFVIDYLVEEVLDQQSDEHRAFLLQTSALDRLCAPLCDAVTEGDDSQRILEHLEQSNLFIIPLDNERHWYRYHHLFADFLFQRLQVQQPERIPGLYLRASTWYQGQGEFEPAIRCALRAGDPERAAHLLDGIVIDLISSSEIPKVLNLVERVPDEVKYRYPRLCLAHAWALVFARQFQDVDFLLAQAEAHLEQPETLPVGWTAGRLAGTLATVRAYAAAWQADYPQAIAYSQHALELLGDTQNEGTRDLRGTVKLNQGIIHNRTGQVREAGQILREALELNRQANNIFATSATAGNLMQLLRRKGRLSEAQALGERTLAWLNDWAEEAGHPLPTEAEIRLHLGWILYEHNHLVEAEAHARRALELFRASGVWEQLLCHDLAFAVNYAVDRVEVALQLHDRMQQLLAGQTFTGFNVRLARQAHRALLLSRRRTDLAYLRSDAQRWAGALGLEPSGPIPFPREYEAATLARVQLEDARFASALELSRRLCREAEATQRDGDLLVYLNLQALALDGLRHRDEAVATLSRALDLAEPEGYIRLFLDEGEAVAKLLRDPALSHGRHAGYVRRLLATPDTTQSREPHVSGLVEPLSDRELEILDLMISGRTGPQVAEYLVISVNTVKTHVRNVYGKLGVNNRFDAIRRARELGLL